MLSINCNEVGLQTLDRVKVKTKQNFKGALEVRYRNVYCRVPLKLVSFATALVTCLCHCIQPISR